MKKKIFVHVGPSKTGTSAIQNWCGKNIDFLRQNNIFYPPHDLDPNGISSGNIKAICDFIPSEVLGKASAVKVSKHKIVELLTNFEVSGCETLIVSSEFFIRHMKQIREQIPNVKFIAYLRNPIDVMESNYNQGVKRSGFTHQINLSSFNYVPHANFLLDYTKKFGSSELIIRFYEYSLHGSTSLVSDFLKCLGLHINVVSNAINSSYNFEALELKRWLNNYSFDDLHSKIDHALQSYNAGVARFSLIPPQQYKVIKKNYITQIEASCEALGINDIKGHVCSIIDQQQSQYREQKLNIEEFKGIVYFLKKKLGDDFEKIAQIIVQEKENYSTDYKDWFHQTRDSSSKRYVVILGQKLKAGVKKALGVNQ